LKIDVYSNGSDMYVNDKVFAFYLWIEEGWNERFALHFFSSLFIFSIFVFGSKETNSKSMKCEKIPYIYWWFILTVSDGICIEFEIDLMRIYLYFSDEIHHICVDCIMVITKRR
jgi:hypothetical protein